MIFKLTMRIIDIVTLVLSVKWNSVSFVSLRCRGQPTINFLIIYTGSRFNGFCESNATIVLRMCSKFSSAFVADEKLVLIYICNFMNILFSTIQRLVFTTRTLEWKDVSCCSYFGRMSNTYMNTSDMLDRVICVCIQIQEGVWIVYHTPDILPIREHHNEDCP